MSWLRRPVDAMPLDGRDHTGTDALPALALAEPKRAGVQLAGGTYVALR
jgi:hypothetical protein